MSKIKFFIYGLFVLLSLNSCAPEKDIYDTDHVGLKLGDGRDWAQIDFDDSDWTTNIDPTGKGVFWLRISGSFKEGIAPLKNQGLLIGATGAYEAYWDGHYLGTNGRLQSATENETPGDYHTFFALPDSLTQQGRHVLALRMTKTSKWPDMHAYFILDDYQYLLREPLRVSLYMFLLAGAFFMMSIYFLFVFANQPREYAILIFSFICLLFLSLLLMEYSKLFYIYKYPFQRTRLEIIGYLHLSLSILIPLFYMLQFSFPWKKWLLLSVGVVVFYLEYNYHFEFDSVAKYHNTLMWVSSVIIVAYACYRQMRGAYIVLAALLASVLVIYLLPKFNIPFVSHFDVTLFIGFIFIVFSMLYLMTIRRREEREAYEASLVLSERLKNELLKKNIKPHFIMNTLTSLIDWVEESPKQGVQFINALADEFEVLNEIADYKQVPIGQEIKLCKSHLKVMGYRKEIIYEWEEEGIDYNDIIPPAIIHTMVENGVTHSLPNEAGKITFRLLFSRTDHKKKYTLQTIAQNRAEENIKNVEGTGLKYIKARLQESYGDRWSIRSEANDTGWESEIIIDANSFKQ